MCLAGCPLLNGKLIACAHTYGVFNLPVVQPSVRCASCSIICVCRASWAAPWHAPPTVIPPPPSSFSPSEPMPPFRACSLSSARSSLFKSKLAGWQERGRDRKGEWARQQREHRRDRRHFFPTPNRHPFRRNNNNIASSSFQFLIPRSAPPLGPSSPPGELSCASWRGSEVEKLRVDMATDGERTEAMLTCHCALAGLWQTRRSSSLIFKCKPWRTRVRKQEGWGGT